MFNTLVYHYTATFVDQDIGAKEIDKMHKARGWSGIGYHAVDRLDGTIEAGRPEDKMGAHVAGQNTGKYGFVTVGGLLRESGPDRGFDTRTDAQKKAQGEFTEYLLSKYPTIKRICGHRDLASTQCPAYDAQAWWDHWKKGAELPSPLIVQDEPPQSHHFLKVGSRGGEVQHLQEHLRNLGYYMVKIDGIFGPRTQLAVRAFQADHNIMGPNMGMVGNTTWAEILLRDPD